MKTSVTKRPGKRGAAGATSQQPIRDHWADLEWSSDAGDLGTRSGR